MASIEIVRPGPLTTVQDEGRTGLGSSGVCASGAADRSAYAAGNRLVGNDVGVASLEVTLGGLRLRAVDAVTVALTGAPSAATADGDPVAFGAAVDLADGALLVVRTPPAGLRTYLALRGGVDVATVLGSRSTDLMAGIGVPLRAGDVLTVGPVPRTPVPPPESAGADPIEAGEVTLRVRLGPRDDWFSADALRVFERSAYTVTQDSNRVGVRLTGPPLERSRSGELDSEGAVPGAVQVPPDGRPVVFLADHPVTGGYPVVAVVLDADLPRLAQLRPGQSVRFASVDPDATGDG